MAKFCKAFENKEGAQLLIFLTESEEVEGKANFVLMFQLEDEAAVQIKIGNGDWDKVEKVLEEYTQEQAEELLQDPMAYVESLMK